MYNNRKKKSVFFINKNNNNKLLLFRFVSFESKKVIYLNNIMLNRYKLCQTIS